MLLFIVIVIIVNCNIIFIIIAITILFYLFISFNIYLDIFLLIREPIQPEGSPFGRFCNPGMLQVEGVG